MCCVEADIEVDFEAPKDYKEMPPPVRKQNSQNDREEKLKAEKLKEIEQKFARIDGKKLSEK